MSRGARPRPFREADAPVVRFLTLDECRRLVNGAEGSFRDLVRAALLTGCRYGELTRLRAGDVNHATGMVTLRETKAGKPRHVALTDEGAALMADLTAGQPADALVFLRDDGQGVGAVASTTPARCGEPPLQSWSRLRPSHPPPHLCLDARDEGCSDGRHRAQLGHADTRITSGTTPTCTQLTWLRRSGRPCRRSASSSGAL